LLEYATRTLFTAETAAWTPRLARARQDLRAALEAQDAERLRDALRRMKELFARQLSRINTRMASVAGMLQLASLVATLQQISQQFDIATDADQHRFGDFRRGVAALVDLDRRLIQSVRLHSMFQEFDDELRRIEATLEQSLSELIDSWPDLGPMMLSICSAEDTEWVTRLRTLGADVEQALTSGDPLKLRRTFGRYRSHATVSFNRVDYELRDLCAELQQIGAPLDRMLRMIA
jgi:HPt (histidine-containing phosphotransfer) domain-containing protein